MRSLIFYTDGIYHVFNRGVNKRKIFEDEQDYARFLHKMYVYSIDLVQIMAYCLMPNHFHFLLEQSTENGVSNFMHRLEISHAKYFNARYERSGALVEPKFKAKHIDHESYYIHISKYIHRNVSDLCPYDEDEKKREFMIEYKWSSMAAYLGIREEKLLDRRIMEMFRDKNDYINFVFDENQNPVSATPGFGDTGF